MEKYEYSVTFAKALARENVASVTEDLRRFFSAEDVRTADGQRFRVVCSFHPTRAHVALNAFCKKQPAAVLTCGIKLSLQD